MTFEEHEARGMAHPKCACRGVMADWKAEREKLFAERERLIGALEKVLSGTWCQWYLPGEGNCLTRKKEFPCIYCQARAILKEVKGE